MSVRSMDSIRIVPTTDALVDGVNRCLDAVARERRWIAIVEGPPPDGSREFVRGVLAAGGVHLAAVDDSLPGDGGARVVGWCDVVRNALPGYGHVGRLGMGLLATHRGRGIGERLLVAALESARANGMRRVELEVYASNGAARALYERMGFEIEGTRRRVRVLDGREDDSLLMALFFPAPPPAID